MSRGSVALFFFRSPSSWRCPTRPTETDSPDPSISRLWLAETRDELAALPASLCALVLSLALLAGVAVSWLGGR